MKALESLEMGKATGLDGIPLEVYREAIALREPIRVLFNSIMSKGFTPRPLLQAHLIPLGKLQVNPKKCASQRPISLVNSLARVLEAVIYRRPLPAAEPQLRDVPRAYRRERGKEMCLTQMIDALHRSLRGGRYVYPVSSDAR